MIKIEGVTKEAIEILKEDMSPVDVIASIHADEAQDLFTIYLKDPIIKYIDGNLYIDYCAHLGSIYKGDYASITMT